MKIENIKTDSEFKKFIAHYGKSFHWASVFLNKTDKKNMRVLYAFCRYVDDIVDESQCQTQAKQHLLKIMQEIKDENSQLEIIRQVLQLIHKKVIKKKVLNQFLSGISWDIENSVIGTQEELIQYCYGVASTVGLQMYSLFGVNSRNSNLYGIDLGIAMQLTNIARDVIKDAKKGRVYLPQSWFNEPIGANAILFNRECRDEVFQAILKLLTLADCYYSSASQGFTDLPTRAYLGVVTAARIYKKIGDKIKNLSSEAYWRANRIHTSVLNKLTDTGIILFNFICCGCYFSVKNAPPHNSSLHKDIQKLINEVGWQ